MFGLKKLILAVDFLAVDVKDTLKKYSLVIAMTYCVSRWLFCFVLFETGSQSVVLASLEL